MFIIYDPWFNWNATCLVPCRVRSYLAPEQEISHVFRAPGRRPPTVLSAAFALLALAPLALLVVMLRSLGINLRVRQCLLRVRTNASYGKVLSVCGFPSRPGTGRWRHSLVHWSC